jgi:hypothetical protein
MGTHVFAYSAGDDVPPATSASTFAQNRKAHSTSRDDDRG